MRNLLLLVQEYRRLRGLKIPPRQALDLAEFYVGFPWSAFIGAIAVAALTFAVLAYVPDVVSDVQPPPQHTDEALVSCINGRGMIINGEVWVCSPTGMRGM